MAWYMILFHVVAAWAGCMALLGLYYFLFSGRRGDYYE